MSNDLIEADFTIAERVNNFQQNAKLFELQLRRLVKEIRTLYDVQDIGELFFTVKVNGRVHGDLKVEFTLGNSTYGGEQVSGATIHPTLVELFRRLGWEAVHAPTSISYSGGRGED